MTQPDPRISAVVAAYNEEETVADVVRTLVISGRFSEIIVVSDGSTDRTKELAAGAGATVYQLPRKNGKGAALMHGVTHTDAPYLFFCDADLLGFEPRHIHAVVDPVLGNELAMCVGLRDRGRFVTRISRYLPLIGGERALRRSIVENIPDTYLQGFMVEAALNYYCRTRKLPYGTRELNGLTIRRKMQKVGFGRGLKEYAKMAMQVIRGMLVVRFARLTGRF